LARLPAIACLALAIACARPDPAEGLHSCLNDSDCLAGWCCGSEGFCLKSCESVDAGAPADAGVPDGGADAGPAVDADVEYHAELLADPRTLVADNFT